MALILYLYAVISCASLAHGAGLSAVGGSGKHGIKRQISEDANDDRTPSNIRIRPGEESLGVYWTPPRDFSSAHFCAIEYKDHSFYIGWNEPRMTVSLTVPIKIRHTSYELVGLQRNRLYKVRLFCFYGNTKGPSTSWIYASTRSTSLENNICTGRLPNAYLGTNCLKRPSDSICNYTCIDGYMKSGFGVARDHYFRLSFLFGSFDIQCVNGTWETGYEKYGHRLENICLPEADFHKCPQSIPNGKLEDYCGPTLDWLCNFECNAGYNRHPYMTGGIKGFANKPEKLLCGYDGVWKTGYEDIGLNISLVCFGGTADKNCTDDPPNGYVYHKPVKSGHSHGMRCLDGFTPQTLDYPHRGNCMNGEWIIRATKYDSSINPQTVCLRNDTTRNCPRNIQNGRVPKGCSVNCRPVCEEGYHVFGEDGLSMAPDSITCEDGEWLTESQPYTGDNICVSSVGMNCSENIPNGRVPGPDYLLKDVERGRRYRSFYCNHGFRYHRSIRYIECIAGDWVTWNERFGLNVSKVCIQETD